MLVRAENSRIIPKQILNEIGYTRLSTVDLPLRIDQQFLGAFAK
jgi:hypothetical protein